MEFRIERWRSVGSTNELIRQRLLEGEPEGLVITAEEQTQGRGRLGRQWQSPKGNLYASVLLRPKRARREWPSLSLVAGLSLVQSLGEPARLKWPNDVLICGAKTAGILLEAEEQALIIGMGVNVTSHPAGLSYPVTSLAHSGIALNADQLLAAWLGSLSGNLAIWSETGFAGVRDDWVRYGPEKGQFVRLRGQGGSVQQARYAGLDEDGAMIVQTAEGQRTLWSTECILRG